MGMGASPLRLAGAAGDGGTLGGALGMAAFHDDTKLSPEEASAMVNTFLDGTFLDSSGDQHPLLAPPPRVPPTPPESPPDHKSNSLEMLYPAALVRAAAARRAVRARPDARLHRRRLCRPPLRSRRRRTRQHGRRRRGRRRRRVWLERDDLRPIPGRRRRRVGRVAGGRRPRFARRRRTCWRARAAPPASPSSSPPSCPTASRRAACRTCSRSRGWPPHSAWSLARVRFSLSVVSTSAPPPPPSSPLPKTSTTAARRFPRAAGGPPPPPPARVGRRGARPLPRGLLLPEPLLDDVPRHRARQRLPPPRDPRRLVARGRRRRRDDTAPSGAAPRALRRLHRRRRHLHAVDAPPHRARSRPPRRRGPSEECEDRHDSRSASQCYNAPRIFRCAVVSAPDSRASEARDVKAHSPTGRALAAPRARAPRVACAPPLDGRLLVGGERARTPPGAAPANRARARAARGISGAARERWVAWLL